MSSINRRRFVRVTPRLNEPITVQLLGKKRLTEILWARDISVGGIAVAIHHDVDAATLSNEVEIMVTLPDCAPFEARAAVRHISTSSLMFGVQFTAIEPGHVALIERYVTARVAEDGVAPFPATAGVAERSVALAEPAARASGRAKVVVWLVAAALLAGLALLFFNR